MSMRVVAVVVSNDQPQFLQSTIAALDKQSFRIERTLIVDSSTEENLTDVLTTFEKSSPRNAVFKVEEKANFAELVATGIKQALSGFDSLNDIAIWVLHDDTNPEVHALAELVRALEISPLVAIASPKQVSIENPKVILQQGLTVTRSLKPFSLVTNELDQKQFDSMTDVLAVTSNAMLIRATSWADLGGFSLDAPEFAADIDLGIRAHQLGSRVVVVPTSRVRHAQLALNGLRKKKWLGGSVKYGMAKATNHLRLSHSPLFFAFLYWLTLPAYSVLQILWLLLVKRPDRILFTLKANLWAFFTIRARLRDRHRYSLKSLKALLATREQVKAKSRIAFEVAEQKLKLENFASTETTRVSQSGFAASGGLWWMFGLFALSFAYLPTGQSLFGGFALPLSDNWLQLFSNTGASYQNTGMGLAAPSDPFNWVLLLIGSLTFWAPNLALSFLLLFAKALAFFGAWRLLSLVTARGGLRAVFALVYALWPAFNVAQSEANIPSVIFAISLPWFIFSLARAARIGITTSIRSSEQSWSWIAASGLLCAVVCVSAPSVLITLIVIGLIFAVLVRKRLAALSFIALPAAALMLPYLVFQVLGNHSWLGILADPTISLPSSQASVLQTLLGKDQVFGWCAVGMLALAILGLLSRAKGVLLAWLIALIALVNLWFVQGIRFTAGGTGSIFLPPTEWVYDSSTPAVMLTALSALVAIVLWLESITRSGFRKFVVTAVFLTVSAPLAFSAVVTPSATSFTDGRNLPAIVAAEAKASSNLRLLVISRDQDLKFRAELIWPAGNKLDTVSTAYRLSPLNAGLATDSQLQQSLTELVGNLVSANGKSPKKALLDAQVGFVLVPERVGNGDLGVALNSVVELDQVGLTEFGQLWRVKSAVSAKKEPLSLWSTTKSVQLGLLLAFVLLALPTSRGRKRKEPLDVSELSTDEVEQ
jgi:GT2 family glycosyltransferase